MLMVEPDLIRHGKAHGNPSGASTKSSDTEPASDASQRSTKSSATTMSSKNYAPTQPQQPISQAAMEKEQIRQQAVAQNVTVPQVPSPDYKAEAELIVQEERESKNKMPVYKGLENFKLVDKMGE
jgi:hypothetical protein